MSSEKAKAAALVAVIVLVVVALLATTPVFGPSSVEKPLTAAPRFNATDVDGANVSLAALAGRPVVLEFVYMTSETCPHCVELNRVQADELRKLRRDFGAERLAILTIDMTYDFSGAQARAARDELNITWPVVNDPFAGNGTHLVFEATGIGGRYIKYLLDDRGALVNPAILLLDQQLRIAGVYRVGVFAPGTNGASTELTAQEKRDLMTAGKLSERIGKLERNEWGATMEGKVYAGMTLGGMFLLGLSVSITPCALMLLLSMTGYVTAVSRRKGLLGPPAPAQPGGGAPAGASSVPAPGTRHPAPGDNVSPAWFGATIGLAFTLGIGLVFFLIGCLFSFIGVVITNAAVFYVFAGCILIIFGIHNIFGMDVIYQRLRRKNIAIDLDAPVEEPREGILERGRKFGQRVVDRYVLFGAFFLGCLLAAGWSPCALAFVLPAMILLMTQGVPVLVGGLYLFVFSLGYGVPIIALAALTTKVKAVFAEKAMKVGKPIPILFGVVIIFLGLLMVARWFGLYLW
jgi:cytochrome c-type biogenesis protein